MPFPPSLSALVQRFQAQRDSYTAPGYNETQLREEFLNPFFDALGWDVYNRQGYAEAYKEVIHEDAVKVGTATKAPDYSFRIGGVRKFFVEAKKPSVSIKDDQSPAFQLRRYAWSAKLPLSILSNFAEFAVYDCRQKPDKNDKASVGRILYITCDEYEKRWDEIASLFTREAIQKGSFDKFASGARRGKGTAEVDDAFLADIEEWRFVLAKNIAIRNPKLSMRELNFAVQRTIDRLIFLRICEDRGIEDYGRLQAHLNGERIYERLCTVFREADDRYNSGLFHFREEKDRGEAPDTVTLALSIDDKILREIITGLYYPESPYEFSVLPADILGQVYEQFLGKVIRLTAGHQAKVEDKPEVRKAGGVFYTPTYIVEYIVKNTVGKLLASPLPLRVFPSPPVERGPRGEADPPLPPLIKGGAAGGGISPKEASNLRILDPACGSGSFLIGAYQYLLDWHRDWYLKNDPEKWTRGKNAALYKTGVGEYRLTTPERKRILLNNIYGVDIDTQAVEVTKLSLLLKVLEGETEQTIAQQLKLFHTRALPDLGNNIKCGNSLIGMDFYHGEQMSMGLFDDEERYRINAFDWDGKGGFPEIMRNGGFDAVLGNPPYGAEFKENEINFLKTKYSTFTLRGESYLLFIEKAHRLLKRKGRFGFIVPDTYLNLEFTRPLRTFILQNSEISEIVILPSKVFQNATVDTTILLTLKEISVSTFHSSRVQLRIFPKKETIFSIGKPLREFEVSTSIWSSQGFFNTSSDSDERKIISKIDSKGTILSSFAEMFSGVKAYEVGKGDPPQTENIRDSKPFTSDKRENGNWSPLYDGKHIGRYQDFWKRNNWITYGPWLAAPRDQENFIGEKILIRKIVGPTLIATYLPATSYCNTLLFLVKLKDTSPISYNYLLGILNSKFIGWYYRKKFQISADDTFPQIMIRDILQFPVPNIVKSLHDKLVSLVSLILDLNKQLPAARDDQAKTLIARQIDDADRQIDALVYELYGLTGEEIAIVEGIPKNE